MKDLASTAYRVRFHSDKLLKPEDRLFRLKAKIWTHKDRWHLITIPARAGKTIKQRFGHTEKGWGSIPVEVKTKGFTWSTSIFHDKRMGSYIMLLKKAAREKNKVKKGDTLLFELRIK